MKELPKTTFSPEESQIGGGGTTVPMVGADGFVRSLNSMMRRTGQGTLVGQSIVELQSTPDLNAVHEAVIALVRRHPILHAKAGKSGFFRPAWRILPPPPEEGLPLGIWSLETPECPSLEWLQDRLLNSPLPGKNSHWNVRFDFAHSPDGASVFLFTWAHLLLDGKGAELLLDELARFPEHQPPASPLQTGKTPTVPLKEVAQHLRTMVGHFTEISRTGFSSPSGPGPRPGRLQFLVKNFHGTRMERIRTRAAEFSGPLFNLPFFLSCACRAVSRVFAARGKHPAQYVVSVPAHVRKKGGQTEIFHNKLTMFFFRMSPTVLLDLKSACRDAFRQFGEMSKIALDKSFSVVLDTMKILHPDPYIRFVLLQGQGEIVSFFHSHTGEFFPAGRLFMGAAIQNAYHIPSVSTPPGVGLFFGEHHGTLNLTLSWREGTVSASEIADILTQAEEDLTGEPAPGSAEAVAAPSDANESSQPGAPNQ